VPYALQIPKIFRVEEEMVQYSITVGDKEYLLHTDFEYSGKLTAVVYKPDMTQLAGAFTPGERVIMIFRYQYDFSAVANGLDGKLYMYAYYDSNNLPMIIGNLWGTGDFRCVQIDAIGEGATHTGTVTGWPE